METFKINTSRLLACFSFLIIMGWWLGAHAGINKQEPYMFRHITTNDGLMNNSITALYRDSKGFLWVGTSAGLDRYDSYHFQTFRTHKEQNRNPEILSIFEDWEGHIWAETRNGYSYFDYKSDQFNEDYMSFLKGLHIASDTILHLGINKQHDKLWAYNANSLYLYDKRQDKTKKMAHGMANISEAHISDEFIYLISESGMLKAINVNTLSVMEVPMPEWVLTHISGQTPMLYVDGSGGLWVHTFQNSKLYYKRNQSTNWKEITLSPDQNLFNRVRDITEDQNGNIWIITSHLGAFILKPGSEDIQHFTNNPFQPQTISSDNLTAICSDKDGLVWLGSFKKGISYYSPQAQVFLSHNILPNSDVISFLEDDKDIWMGTDGGGLLKLSDSGNDTYSVPVQANIIQTIKADKNGILWIGTYQNGIVKYDHGKTEHIHSNNSNLSNNIVYALQFDKEGMLWIATLNGNVQKMNTSSGNIETVFQGNFNIRDLVYDGDHSLYAGTSSGLMRIDTQTGKHEIVKETKSFIIALCKDSKNNIWFGTANGLTYYNIGTRESKTLTTTDGLSSNSVTAIIEDNNQQLWVGTANGLNRLKWTGETYNIAKYYESDGIVSNTINERAMYRQKNGSLLIGTPNGYTIAIPQHIVSQNYHAQVHLTELSSSVQSIWEKLHKSSMELTDEISLPEGQTSAVARFSTLDFTNKGQISYFLRVNSSEDNWVRIDGNEIRTTLLPEGDYKLDLKACDIDGNFTPEIKTITVHVLPPFYRTKWAYVAYALLILLIITIIQQNHKKRKEKAQLRDAMQKENEHQKKIMDMKLQFFANVSHELRTPLTLIINPLEEFMRKYPQYQNSLLSTVSQNSKYLMELINQLLDFRKLDVVGENISYIHCDLVELVHDQFQSFESMANLREIKYSFEAEKSVIMMDCDYDKLRKIVLNILSNAFKYTSNGGSISIEVKPESRNTEQWVTLSFKDNGCGIDKEKRDKIFECFYQVESLNHSQGGSGIGLYLVKKYVDLHHGEISVSDNQPQGTVFTISLPTRASVAELVKPETEKEEKNAQHETSQNRNYTILVVDDNVEFLNFLAASISTQYNVLRAMNGEEALQTVNQENVDLIISDVMMPVMDGLQLCKAIKSDINTSHIPVILLTAKAGDDYQIEGLNFGADDYITKPFSMEILKIRLKKMLENNLKRQEQFDKEVKIEPSKITITPLDQQFIQKAIQVVEDNLENSDFSVEMLADQLSLSRGHLYKKLSKITGKNPIDFIRVIRLKRAQQLLQESQLQISEIAYKLGYNSPKLFTKHFKEAFNMTPSEYAAQFKP